MSLVDKFHCSNFCFLMTMSTSGMITGAAAATVYYNLKLRHPTLDMPIIDYDLALLFQPMLVLGISIGVVLNVILADWMITVLLIILFIGIDFPLPVFLHTLFRISSLISF